MQNSKIVTITSQQYAHLPSMTHKLVVNALVDKGQWKIVITKPVITGGAGK
jgi:hypothetical protein